MNVAPTVSPSLPAQAADAAPGGSPGGDTGFGTLLDLTATAQGQAQAQVQPQAQSLGQAQPGPVPTLAGPLTLQTAEGTPPAAGQLVADGKQPPALPAVAPRPAETPREAAGDAADPLAVPKLAAGADPALPTPAAPIPGQASTGQASTGQADTAPVPKPAEPGPNAPAPQASPAPPQAAALPVVLIGSQRTAAVAGGKEDGPAGTPPGKGTPTRHGKEGAKAAPDAPDAAAALALATPADQPVAQPIPSIPAIAAQAGQGDAADDEGPALSGGAAPAVQAAGATSTHGAPASGVEAGAGAAAATDNLPSLLVSQTAAPLPQGTPAIASTYAAQMPRVSEPVVTAEPGRIGHDMGVEIARQVSAGRDEFLVRLTPADMGRVDVRLAFDEKGSLHATVSAESPAALEMLRRDAGDLGRALTDAGVPADAASFHFDQRGGEASQFAQQQPDARGGGRDRQSGGSRRDEAARSGISKAGPLYRPLRTNGRIDLTA